MLLFRVVDCRHVLLPVAVSDGIAGDWTPAISHEVNERAGLACLVPAFDVVVDAGDRDAPCVGLVLYLD